jgi:type I pantothenate kinase
MVDGCISASEIADVYVPLARRIGTRLLRDASPPVPVVAVVGSVAVGKSTTARALRELIAALPDRPHVELVATDGFLLPNAELDARGLTMRKGFPESYDLGALARFLVAAKHGADELRVPVYSHDRYDIVPGAEQVVARPRLLVMEGLALTEPDVASLVDFVIYLDADERDIRDWFLARFVAMFSEDLLEIAYEAWDEINLVNLHEHILPARERADVVLEKRADHVVSRVVLREPGRDTMDA